MSDMPESDWCMADLGDFDNVEDTVDGMGAIPLKDLGERDAYFGSSPLPQIEGIEFDFIQDHHRPWLFWTTFQWLRKRTVEHICLSDGARYGCSTQSHDLYLLPFSLSNITLIRLLSLLLPLHRA
jgi:hypothetical protein